MSSMVARMLALTGLGLLIGMADSWIRPVQMRLVPPSPGDPGVAPALASGSVDPPRPSDVAPDVSFDPAALGIEITLEQSRFLFEAGAPFIDARLDPEYAAERVQGALHLTTAMFSGATAPEALTMLDPSMHVVIYCSGGDCDASHSVGIRLQQAGFERIHIMTAGFAAWKAAGLPIETGAPDGAGD